MHSINHKEGKAFFLHSAGGGGKTFVCNIVASTIRSNEHVALAVASSAVAAQILELGRTCHSDSRSLFQSTSLQLAGSRSMVNLQRSFGKQMSLSMMKLQCNIAIVLRP